MSLITPGPSCDEKTEQGEAVGEKVHSETSQRSVRPLGLMPSDINRA